MARRQQSITVVMMSRQLTVQHATPTQGRGGRVWVAFPALGGALVALALPGASGTTAAGATVLAVGALALLAGHGWGLFVSVPSHVTLAGRLWPSLLLQHPGAHHAIAAAVVLVTALPALALTVVILPQIANHLLADRGPRARTAFVACSAAGLIASLIVPALVA